MQNTEKRNPLSKNIDKMQTGEILRVIQDENYNAVKSLEAAMPDIEKACNAIHKAFNSGGRLFYIGAGTSGRLGVVDASECPPTYGVSPDTVIGIIAGGKDCMFVSKEGVEDDEAAGKNDLAAYNIMPRDVAVGISAAGNSKYIVSAIAFAKSVGCKTVSVTCNAGCLLDKVADIKIVTDTGAEVVTGSTRMKAGTAQKLVLNMLTTCTMIKNGKVYENLMINVKPVNIKLKRRMIYIVTEILGCGETRAKELLDENGWEIRKIAEKFDKRR